MKVLEDFSQSVLSLQQEVENFKDLQQTYQKFVALAHDYEKVLAEISAARENIGIAKTAIENFASDAHNTLCEQEKLLKMQLIEQKNKLEQELTKQRNLQEEQLVEQKQLLGKEMEEFSKLLSAKLALYESLIETKSDLINQSNHRFYTEFTDTVQVRLDNNRMEIKQLIDTDSQGVRQQIIELKREFKNTEAIVTQQLLTLKKLNVAFGIIIVILSAILIIMGVK